eukprot:15132696-Ditylum_brightwellii.AAC.1
MKKFKLQQACTFPCGNPLLIPSRQQCRFTLTNMTLMALHYFTTSFGSTQAQPTASSVISNSV